MVEYASLTAALALLTATLAGSLGHSAVQVPAHDAAALQLVASNARTQKAPVAQARSAYRKAPYSKPALKYVFAVGWISGVKNRASCLFTRVSPKSAEKEATSEIRRNGKVTAKLRSRGVSTTQASSALVRGIVSACS
jgi:hypothetical protein